MTPSTARAPDSLSLVLVHLMKGAVYQDADPALWQLLLNLQPRAREHMATLGLQLVVDETEGYAYLRQRPVLEGEPELPRLVPRRQLGFGVSLLLALLRKRLAEAEASGGDTRLVLTRDALVGLVRDFLPDSTNEVKHLDRVGADIARVVEMGFLRKLNDSEATYEVRRILKAFVDAQWLEAFSRRLAEYRALLGEGGVE